MNGKHHFDPGQEVLVYLSSKPNLFDGKIEKRIGKAIIKKSIIKKVKDLTEKEASQCGLVSLKGLKIALQKWYQAKENSTITFVKFNLLLE